MGRILAKRLNGIVCDDFLLSEPGYNLVELISKRKFSKEEPLIMVINEHDENIKKMKNCKIREHRDYMTISDNLSSLNNFMDQTQDYDNLISIFTSNKDLNWFRDEESSCVRAGRINVVISIDIKGNSNFEVLSNGNDIASEINVKKFTEKFEDIKNYIY